MSRAYKITPVVWLVRDEASVKFHVTSHDYFGTIAAILSLIKQQFKKGDAGSAVLINKTLKNLEKDLMFLQKNYQIKPKNKKRISTPKGRLKSQ